MVDTIITVEGHFDYHHPAERGTVRLSAGFEGPDRASVLSYTTTLYAELSRQAEKLKADRAVTWWSADRVRVWSDRPWNKDGKQLPLVHHATVGLEVKFSDLSGLASWVEKVGAQNGVTVSGVEWALTEATRARISTEAQNGAVQDAVGRATAYARSLGLQSVHAVALADPGMLGVDSQVAVSYDMPLMARSAPAPGSGGDDELDLKPEDITVSARVHARFAAS